MAHTNQLTEAGLKDLYWTVSNDIPLTVKLTPAQKAQLLEYSIGQIETHSTQVQYHMLKSVCQQIFNTK